MSKIQIIGNTKFPKQKIEKQVVNLVNNRLVIIKEEIQSALDELSFFEKKYDMNSKDFLNKFSKGELGDDEELLIWKASIKILEKLNSEQELLQETM